MSFTLTGNQAHFLAAVAIGHPAAEYFLDGAPLPAVQHHGRRDDAARPDAVDSVRLKVFGEEVNRMGMSENQRRSLAAHRADEACQRRLVHLERIQIGSSL